MSDVPHGMAGEVMTDVDSNLFPVRKDQVQSRSMWFEDGVAILHHPLERITDPGPHIVIPEYQIKPITGINQPFR